MADLANSTISLIAGFEGLQLNAYLLGGIPHIGYGFTYYQSGYLRNKFGRSNVRIGDKITQADADQELEIILNDFADYVNSRVLVELSQNQFDALLSLCYNIGKSAFANSTLLALLNQGNYSGASAEFDRWVYSGGVVNAGLVERRNAEQSLFGSNSIFAGSNILLWIIVAIIIGKLFFKKK